MESTDCNFGSDLCLWFNMGNSSWQRAASRANESWFLEASTRSNIPADEIFILESARFNAPASKGLFFRYQMAGSSSVSISLQSQQEGGIWTRVFLRTGDAAISWQTGIVTVPDGAVALRIVGNVTTALDVVRVELIQTLHVASSSDDLACSFEHDFCSWLDDGKQSWQRKLWLSSPGAADGDWYLHTAWHSKVRFVRVPCCILVW